MAQGFLFTKIFVLRRLFWNSESGASKTHQGQGPGSIAAFDGSDGDGRLRPAQFGRPAGTRQLCADEFPQTAYFPSATTARIARFLASDSPRAKRDFPALLSGVCSSGNRPTNGCRINKKSIDALIRPPRPEETHNRCCFTAPPGEATARKFGTQKARRVTDGTANRAESTFVASRWSNR